MYILCACLLPSALRMSTCSPHDPTLVHRRREKEGAREGAACLAAQLLGKRAAYDQSARIWLAVRRSADWSTIHPPWPLPGKVSTRTPRA